MTHEPHAPTATTARNAAPEDCLRRLLSELYPDGRPRLRAEPVGYHHAALRIYVPTPAPQEAPEHLRGIVEPVTLSLATPLRLDEPRQTRRRRTASR